MSTTTQFTHLASDNRTQAPKSGWQLMLSAHAIAESAHAGALDKAGMPYISHCERVSGSVAGRDAQIVGLLHDTLEKSDSWNARMLLQAGFPEVIVEAVQALTRHPDEQEEHFLRRISEIDLATTVKLADLEDNIDQARRAGLATDKYVHELQTLRQMRDRSSRHLPVRARPALAEFAVSLLAELGLSRFTRTR